MDKKLIPLKKDGWDFNWKKLSTLENGQTYLLSTVNSPNQTEGALCLKIEYDMLIMEALELAPPNVGRDKRYDYVAGCLIAFGCKESFKISGAYKGFLTFVAKTKLIQWYQQQYGAELALGQRMFTDWETGEKLIEKYLNRTKNSQA
ncbi:MAG: hypothetical protein AAFX87_09360 [Bacteroidota bacterium]